MVNKKKGRPSKYTAALGNEVCARLAQGESMRTIGKDESLPCVRTMFNWLTDHESFLQQYEKAKADCAEMYAEDIIEIADDSSNDYEDVNDQNGATGATRLNTEHVQRSRLRIDARKWVASKLKPKKYGDKIQQDITVTTKVEKMTDEELDEHIRSLS